MIFIQSIHTKSQQATTTRKPAFWPPPPPPPPPKNKLQIWKKMLKLQILKLCNEFCTRHAFWGCLIRIANMKWIRLILRKVQSGHDSVHRRMDRLTDWRTNCNQYTPFQLRWSGGYTYHLCVSWEVLCCTRLNNNRFRLFSSYVIVLHLH